MKSGLAARLIPSTPQLEAIPRVLWDMAILILYVSLDPNNALSGKPFLGRYTLVTGLPFG